MPAKQTEAEVVLVTHLATAIRSGDLPTARQILSARPSLVHLDLSEHNEHRALHLAVLSTATPTWSAS